MSITIQNELGESKVIDLSSFELNERYEYSFPNGNIVTDVTEVSQDDTLTQKIIKLFELRFNCGIDNHHHDYYDEEWIGPGEEWEELDPDYDMNFYLTFIPPKTSFDIYILYMSKDYYYEKKFIGNFNEDQNKLYKELITGLDDSSDSRPEFKTILSNLETEEKFIFVSVSDDIECCYGKDCYGY